MELVSAVTVLRPIAFPETCQDAEAIAVPAILPSARGFPPETRVSPAGRFSVTETAWAASIPVSVTFAVIVKGVPRSAVAGPETVTARAGAEIGTVFGGRVIA